MKNDKFIKMIGNVKIDYSKYPGRDLYSDGNVENILLEACKAENENKLLRNSDSWPILYHLSDIRENLVEWLPISDKMDVLEIGSGCGGITSILSKKAGNVTCVELSEKRSLINAYRNKEKDNIEILLGNFQSVEPELGKYDVITLIGVLEYAKMYIKSANPFLEMIKTVRKHIKHNGILVIAIENKMGIKYWNGASEDHTGKMYSGLNDYTNKENVRTFSKNELEGMLQKSGFKKNMFYYPLPDYKLPSVTYSDRCKPLVGRVRTYKKVYSSPRFYNFMEDVVSDQLCYDNKFDYMANSFLTISQLMENTVDVLFSKYNRERKEQFRIATYIVENTDKKIVEKLALNESSKAHIMSMKENEKKWEGTLHNVKTVHGEVIENKYVSDYINGKCLDEFLYECRLNEKQFVETVKKYLNDVLTPDKQSLKPFYITDNYIKIFGSNYIEGEMCSPVTNIDTIFSNLKVNKGNIYAFDFEWVFDFPIPYKYVLWRAATDAYYQYYAYLKNLIAYQRYEHELGFSDKEVNVYSSMEKNFGFYVCGNQRNEEYLKNYQKNVIMQESRFC